MENKKQIQVHHKIPNETETPKKKQILSFLASQRMSVSFAGMSQ